MWFFQCFSLNCFSACLLSNDDKWWPCDKQEIKQLHNAKESSSISEWFYGQILSEKAKQISGMFLACIPHTDQKRCFYWFESIGCCNCIDLCSQLQAKGNGWISHQKWHKYKFKIHGCKIQDISTSISIKSRIQKKMHELTEMSSDDNESDKHI